MVEIRVSVMAPLVWVQYILVVAVHHLFHDVRHVFVLIVPARAVLHLGKDSGSTPAARAVAQLDRT